MIAKKGFKKVGIIAQDYSFGKEAVDAFKKKLTELSPSTKIVAEIFNPLGTKDYAPRYLVSGCGMGRDATLWLLDKGIKIVGTDAWSWDRPLPYIADEFRATGNSSVIWEGHFAGIEKEYCHMEKLTNLAKLPPYGFQVACFPIKIRRASAGWVRAVAILP